MNEYYAHSENKHRKKHTALDHLLSVALCAEKFAEKTGWNSEARLAGLLHDLGKYADTFQARLRGEAGGLDHWSSGEWVALSEYHAVATALAVQGHHVGLQMGGNDALRNLHPATIAQHHPLNLKLSDSDLGHLRSRANADGLTFLKPEQYIINPREGFKNPVASMLDVRMLFSCLTDADFLDTEAHFEGDENGKKHREKGPLLNAVEALRALERHMTANVRKGSFANEDVLGARNMLWDMVSVSSVNNPGLFTLTAPTGSGKTLAMLKFALEHAARNSLKRIILAVPFLSIIEQTAVIYRSVFQSFSDHYVLEHHSLAGLGSEEAKGDAEVATERYRRLLAENWDAPVIITTNVQLLESLFSNRPSACRKLHNLME